MAVYTPLTAADIRVHLKEYALGTLTHHQGIAEGVENSNFLVETSTGRYILTLFEKRITEQDLPYCLGLMDQLAFYGIPCPRPLPDRTGAQWRMLKGKPSAIVSFLPGRGVTPAEITTLYCKALGGIAAYMHGAAEEFPLKRPNTLGLAGWHELAAKIGSRADEISVGLAGIIRQELDVLSAAWPKNLPSGPIHADLFPDNVFAQDDALCGVIDFYFACDDAYAYDLAICAAAWCFDTEHRFVPDRMRALLVGYNNVHDLTPAENAAFPLLLRGACLRFLLTRAHDLLFHPEGALVTPKDPLEYMHKLQFFQQMKSL